MSGISEKQKMRDALQLTERNLGGMIAARYTPTSVQAPEFAEAMIGWRNVCRRALGYAPMDREGDCPRCAIRDGFKEIEG